MKKRIVTVVFSLLLLTALLCIPVFSDGEASYSETAPGGEVSSPDELKTAFGGDTNVTVTVEGEETHVFFNTSIKLSSPVVIKSGTYRIFGRDCTLFRGFENGSLILLDGTLGGEPKLIIDETSLTDWETGKTAIFTFDGNASEYPSVSGALLTVKGAGAIDFNGKVLFKNAKNKEYGGAIYVETVDGKAPSVKLKGSKITECVSHKGGGGIAFFGGKSGEGAVTVTDVIIEKCESLSDGNDAKGGAFYTNGGRISLSGACQLLDNRSDIGGGGYIGGFAEIEGITFRRNSATVSGGALHCGVDAARGTSGSVAMNNALLAYNTTGGCGGAIANEGTLLIGGDTYITDSKAKKDGGGVYNLGSFGFSAGDIITNMADGKAGAVYNGIGGILIVSGGRIASNEASICGGIYSEGVFEFKGGSIGKNIGSVPQNLASGIIRMSDLATFTDTEVIGLLVKKGEEPPVISIEGKLTSRVKQTVAFFELVTNESGVGTARLVSKSGMKVFSSENAEDLQSAVEGFKAYGEGLKSFKIKPDGRLSFKMPIMPIWGWLLTLLGVVGAVFGVLILVKKLKKNGATGGEEKASESDNDVTEWNTEDTSHGSVKEDSSSKETREEESGEEQKEDNE